MTFMTLQLSSFSMHCLTFQHHDYHAILSVTWIPRFNSATLCFSVCEIYQAYEHPPAHILSNLTSIFIIHISINYRPVPLWPAIWPSEQCRGIALPLNQLDARSGPLLPKPRITLIIDAQLTLFHYPNHLYQTKPWLTNAGIHQTPLLINIPRFPPSIIRDQTKPWSTNTGIH